MATIFNCAVDWTLDIAWADADSVKPLPLRRGVYSPKNYTEGQKFMQWLKTDAKFFAEDWMKLHDNKKYSCGTWVGDAWLNHISDCISDYYKDTYNQRPHFMYEFFAMMCGLPTSADTIIRWDNFDEDCRESAKRHREQLTERLA